MRINLGSGWHPIKGFLNVDLYYPSDLKADLRTVEFPAGTVDEVIAVHVIEHFSRDDGLNLIERAFRWLKPGGIITLEWPDQDKCRELMRTNPLEGAKGILGGRSVDKKEWHQWIKGWAARGGNLDETIPDRWNLPGEQHLYVWGGIELAAELENVGFQNVKLQHPMFHSALKGRDSRVVGVKP